MRSLFVLSILAAGVSGALVGQRYSAAYIGGGVDAIGARSAYDPGYGLSLQAGYVRQLNRVGLRLGATYVERDRNLSSNQMERIRVVGANAELSYDLTTSHLRPYLVAGVGLYRFSSTWSTSGGGLWVADGVSPAVLGGLGLRYRVGKIDLYVEARAHGFTNGRNCGCFVAPVTIGVRFD